MSRLFKKHSHKSGLPPGSLVPHPEAARVGAHISIYSYDKESYSAHEDVSTADLAIPPDSKRVTWIAARGLTDILALQAIGDCFKSHSLVLEDILNTDHRIKMEEYEEYIYFVLRLFRWHEAEKHIESEQVSIILGGNFVVSFHESDKAIFEPIRKRMVNGKGLLRNHEADYLAYTLMDVVVDGYLVVLEKVADEIDLLEEKILNRPDQQTLNSLHRLRRELLLMRKSTWPLRDMIASLERNRPLLFRKSTAPFLRDLYDHIFHVVETMETFREILASLLDHHLTMSGNRVNEVMKVLTVIATIFMPLTFVAGIYGMNFRHMPELEWRYGYPAVWIVLILIVICMIFFFKKKKWF